MVKKCLLSFILICSFIFTDSAIFAITALASGNETVQVRTFDEFEAALMDPSVTSISVNESFSFERNIGGILTKGIPNRDVYINGNADKGVVIDSRQYTIYGNQNTKASNTFSIVNANITGRGTPKVDDYTDGRFFTGGQENGPVAYGWDVYAKDVKYTGARFVHLSNGTLTFDGNNEIYTNCENAWVNHVVFKAGSTYQSSNSGTGDYGAFYFNKGKGIADGTAVIESGARTYFNIGTYAQPVFTGDVYKTTIGEAAVFDVNTLGHAVWYVAGSPLYYKMGNPEFNAEAGAFVNIKQVEASLIKNSKSRTNPLPNLYVPVYFAKALTSEAGGAITVKENATFYVTGKTTGDSFYPRGVIRMGDNSIINITSPKDFDIKNNAANAPAISGNVETHYPLLRTEVITLNINNAKEISTWKMLVNEGAAYDNNNPFATYENVSGEAVIKGLWSESTSTDNAKFNSEFKAEDYGRLAMRGESGQQLVNITVYHKDADKDRVLYTETVTAVKDFVVKLRSIHFTGYRLKDGQATERTITAAEGATATFLYTNDGSGLETKFGTVIVEHKDKAGATVLATESFNEAIGLSFKAAAKEFDGWAVENVPAAIIVTEGVSKLTVTYTNTGSGVINPAENNYITVNHKADDTAGQLLLSDRTLAEAGKKFTAYPRVIDGYKAKDNQAKEIDVLTGKDYILEFFYEIIPPQPEMVTLTIIFKNADKGGEEFKREYITNVPLGRDYSYSIPDLSNQGYVFDSSNPIAVNDEVTINVTESNNKIELLYKWMRADVTVEHYNDDNDSLLTSPETISNQVVGSVYTATHYEPSDWIYVRGQDTIIVDKNNDNNIIKLYYVEKSIIVPAEDIIIRHINGTPENALALIAMETIEGLTESYEYDTAAEGKVSEIESMGYNLLTQYRGVHIIEPGEALDLYYEASDADVTVVYYDTTNNKNIETETLTVKVGERFIPEIRTYSDYTFVGIEPAGGILISESGNIVTVNYSEDQKPEPAETTWIVEYVNGSKIIKSIPAETGHVGETVSHTAPQTFTLDGRIYELADGEEDTKFIVLIDGINRISFNYDDKDPDKPEPAETTWSVEYLNGSKIIESLPAETGHVGETVSHTAPQTFTSGGRKYALAAGEEKAKSIVLIDGVNKLTFRYNITTTGGGGPSGGDSGGGNTIQKPAPIETEINLDDQTPLGLGLIKEDHIKYVSGYPDGSFGPDQSITRAEAAMIFYNLLTDVNKTGYDASFPDVKQDTWYYDAVNYLTANGIISGYPNGNFHPNQPITRAEFATLASKFDELSESDANIFTDVSRDHWAFKFINSAAIKGWVKGYENGQFKPDLNITRAEVVTLVNNMLNRGIEEKDIPTNATRFTDVHANHWAYTQIIEAANMHNYTRKENGYETWLTQD